LSAAVCKLCSELRRPDILRSQNRGKERDGKSEVDEVVENGIVEGDVAERRGEEGDEAEVDLEGVGAAAAG